MRVCVCVGMCVSLAYFPGLAQNSKVIIIIISRSVCYFFSQSTTLRDTCWQKFAIDKTNKINSIDFQIRA